MPVPAVPTVAAAPSMQEVQFDTMVRAVAHVMATQGQQATGFAASAGLSPATGVSSNACDFLEERVFAPVQGIFRNVEPHPFRRLQSASSLR